MNRRSAVLAVLGSVALAVTALLAATPAGAARTACPTGWGSTAESAASTAVSPLTNVRGGQSACYDRLVLDFRGKTTGYTVRYVTQVTQPANGHVVPVRGGAKLQITAAAPAYDSAGHATYSPANNNELVNVSGWRTFRQVVLVSSFEGYTDLGLGVRARLPFRVLRLDGPGAGSRLVIDVAHSW